MLLLTPIGCERSKATLKSDTATASVDSISAQGVRSSALRAAPLGKGIAVDVGVKSLTLREDTVGIAYVLYTRPESRDSLAVFAVDAPAGVTSIPDPLPKTDWWVSPKYKGRNIAYWASLGALPPGTTSIPLFFESVGLPGIVTYWIEGDFPIPEGEGEDSTSHDSLRDNSVLGKTVGVEKPLSRLTPQLLLARLRSLTEASCADSLRWITNSVLCNQLLADIDLVISAHSIGRTAQAKKNLDHYRSSLALPSQAAPANNVTSSAYWLLRSNAEIVDKVL